MKTSATAMRPLAVAALLAILGLAVRCAALTCNANYSNNPYNCSCSIYEGDDNILSCNTNDDGGMTVHLTASSAAKVICNPNVAASDFHHLDGINITSLREMHFERCPVPRQTFMQVFQIQKPLELKYLRFVYKVREENLTFQLEGLKGLEELDMSFNSFRNIDPEALASVPNLLRLYLRRNRLTSISKELVDKVPLLTNLDLGDNNITSISPGAFANLTSLRFLNLDKNKLFNASLSAETFQGLSNLTVLDLGYNSLEHLPADLFKHLTNLEKLGLNGNNFEVLPAGLLSPLAKLESFKLVGHSGSRLVLPSGLFANLTMLADVNMDSSNVEALPEDVFYGAVALVNVSLKGNRIKEVSENLFRDNANIHSLILTNNEISALPRNVFRPLHNLEKLDLSYNRIVNITEGVFHQTTQMTELYLQNNRLALLDRAAFRSENMCRLTHIDLANNYLTFEPSQLAPDQSPLSHCPDLKVINLSNNSIAAIGFIDFGYLREPTIDLRRNRLQDLPFSVIYNIGGKIDLSFNNISRVDIVDSETLKSYLAPKDSSQTDSLEVSRTKEKKEFVLDGNPLHCDCHNYLFVKYLEGLQDRKVKKSEPLYDMVELNARNVKCASPRALEGRRIQEVRSAELTCPLKQEMRSKPCPASCECKTRTADKALLVQCAGARLTMAPPELPTSLATNHTELNISHNAIAELPLLNQPGYEHLTKLYASHNRIHAINTSSIPATLQVLELDHNNLTKLEPRVIEFLENNLTNLTSLTLHNNSWDCHCGAIKFINFVQEVKDKIQSVKQVKCTGILDGRSINDLIKSEVCTNVSAVVWVAVVVVVCVVICALVIFYYRYQQEIKVWLFAHRMCLWWVTEEELDKDKRYDAFLCYSNKDQAFVDEELVPNLESGPTPFKLCIHDRDWIPGAWINNQIIESVQHSRRTIIVLSPNFVASEWGKVEFQTAHSQAMREGRARVIIVMFGDVGPVDNLEPELRAYINMNTYVKWGDPWFWDKLRYALPHPPELLRSHPAMALVRQASLRRKPVEDRLELICDPNCPSVIVSPTPPPPPPPSDDTILNNEKNAKLNDNNGIILTPQKTAPAAS